MVRRGTLCSALAVAALASSSFSFSSALAVPSKHQLHIPRRAIRRLDLQEKRVVKRHDCSEEIATMAPASSSNLTAPPTTTNMDPQATLPMLQATPSPGDSFDSAHTSADISSSPTPVEDSDTSRTTIYVDVTVTEYADSPAPTSSTGAPAGSSSNGTEATQSAHNPSSMVSASTQGDSIGSTGIEPPASTSTAVPAINHTARCPPGSHFATFSDDFASFDESKWTFETGDFNSTSFGQDGLAMELREDMQNVVFQSTKQWLPPLSMAVEMKSTEAPQVVSCVIFKNANQSDEIDLELIEDTWQVPIWRDAHRLEFGRDVTGKLASSSQNLTSWVYQDKDLAPYASFNEYKLEWSHSSVHWYVNGKSSLMVEKLNTTQLWPSTEPLHIRFGPWVAGGDWAGVADWKKFPTPTQHIRSIVVEGCMLD